MDRFVLLILTLGVQGTFWIPARCEGIPDYSQDYYSIDIANALEESAAIWSLRYQNEDKPDRCRLGYGKGRYTCHLGYGKEPKEPDS